MWPGRTDEKSSAENKVPINDDRPKSLLREELWSVSSFCYKSVWNKRVACIGTMQNTWGLGTAQQAFWIWFLEIGFKNRAVVPRRTACRNYASFCYEVKCGKYTSLKGTQQKWFVRFRILDAVYNEYELKVDIVGKAEHHSTRNSRLKSSSLICW